MTYSINFRSYSQRIIIVFAVWIVQFLTYLINKSTGVLLPELLEHFESHTGIIGATVSLLFVAAIVLGLFAQPLTKVTGGRVIIVSCGILSAIGLFVGSLATDILALVIGMFLTGFLCIANTVALGLLSKYFTTYYNLVANIVTSALPISFMASAPLTQLMIDIYGWRGTMLILSAFALNAIPAGAVLRLSTPNNEQTKLLPKEVDDNSFYKHIFVYVSMFSNGHFLIVLAICFISGYVFNGWVVYMVSIALSKGLSPSVAASVATFGGVGSLFLRIILLLCQGNSSHYRYLFTLASVLLMISYFGMYLVSSFWLLSLCSFIWGLGDGVLSSQVYTAANDNMDGGDAVGGVALVHVFSGTGYVVSGYISGWLYDLNGNFNATLLTQTAVSSVILVALGIEYIAVFRKKLKQ